MPSYGIQIKQQMDMSVKNNFIDKKYVVLDKPIRLIASEYSNAKLNIWSQASVFIYTIYLLRTEYQQNFVYGYVITRFNHPYYYPEQHLVFTSLNHSTKVGPNWSTSTGTWKLNKKSLEVTKRHVRKKILDLISASYIPIELASPIFQETHRNPTGVVTREECHHEMNLIHTIIPINENASTICQYGCNFNYITKELNNYWSTNVQWSDPSEDLHNLFLRKGKKNKLTKEVNLIENLDEVLF